MLQVDWDKIFKHSKLNSTHDQWQGAVLLLVDEANVYMIKRSLQMPSHPNQLAFFGGLRKSTENNPIDVSLREFEEESSLDRKIITPFHCLGDVYTSRNLCIVPVVGRLNMPVHDFFSNLKTNGEWSDAIAIPLALLTQRVWNYSVFQGQLMFKIYFFPLLPNEYLHHGNNPIKPLVLWGASALMLKNFLDLYLKES